VKLDEVLRPEAVVAELAGATAAEVLGQLCRPVAASTGLDAGRLTQVLLDRERLGSTSVGEGVAIPHGRLPDLAQLTAAFGRSPGGIDFHAVDGRPVRLFLVLFAPEHAAGTYVKVLARASRLFRSPAFREAILAAPDAASIWGLISAEDGKN